MELNRLSPPAEVPSSKINFDAKPSPELELVDLYLILQLQPNDTFIAMELAKRLIDRNKLSDGARILRSVLKIDSRFETLNALAQVEYRLDEMDQAFTHLQQALLVAPEGAPELFDVFKTLGNIFVRHGDLDSAEDNYFKAHRLNPRSDVLHINLGTLAIQRGHWDEATEKFRTALGLNPSNDKAWVGLALCHRTKGDWELAWGNLEAALEYNPLNEVAIGLAIEWSTHEGREFRALEWIRNFLVEGGWNEKLSIAFVWLAWRHGDKAAARLELERLLTVNPKCEAALRVFNELRGVA